MALLIRRVSRKGMDTELLIALHIIIIIIIGFSLHRLIIGAYIHKRLFGRHIVRYIIDNIRACYMSRDVQCFV